MKKIGGINMNTKIRLTGQLFLNSYKSFEKSLKEVKLHREGKIYLDTWDEYLEKKRNHKE